MTTSRTSSLSWRTLALAAVALGVACVHAVHGGERLRSRDAMVSPGSTKLKAVPSPGGGGGSRSRGVSTFTSTGGSSKGVQTYTNPLAKAVRAGKARVSTPMKQRGKPRSSAAGVQNTAPRARQTGTAPVMAPRTRQAGAPPRGPLNSGAIVQVAQREPMVRAAIALPSQRPAPKRNAFAMRVYSAPPAEQFTDGPGSVAARAAGGSTH